MGPDINFQVGSLPDGAVKDIPLWMGCSLLGRQLSEFAQAFNERVITGDGACAMVGDQVGSAVADMPNRYLATDEDGRRQGCAPAGHSLDDGLVGLFESTADQVLERWRIAIRVRVAEKTEQRRLC